VQFRDEIIPKSATRPVVGKLSKGDIAGRDAAVALGRRKAARNGGTGCGCFTSAMTRAEKW